MSTPVLAHNFVVTIGNIIAKNALPTKWSNLQQELLILGLTTVDFQFRPYFVKNELDAANWHWINEAQGIWQTTIKQDFGAWQTDAIVKGDGKMASVMELLLSQRINNTLYTLHYHPSTQMITQITTQN